MASSPLDCETADIRVSGPLATVRTLIAALNARDHYSSGHSQQVSMYAVALGRAVGLSQDDLNVLRTAALLHDVGKIGIPDELLNKEEALSPEEIEVFHSHCAIGVAIISHVPALVKCSPLVLYHHEHFNGQGYPEKLKGEDIPIGARIIAVADAFAAMVSVRPYRKALTYEEAVKELLRCRGKSLDPNLVDLFIPLITTETQTGMKAATGLYGEE